MRRSLAVVAASAVLLAATPTRAELTLKDTDRVMFFSTTPLWPASFGLRAETFLRVRYPALETRFWQWSPPANATIDNAKQNMDRRLAAFKPTVVVLNFGLHHGQSQSLRTSRLGTFRANLQGLINKCEKAGARVILVTPNCPEVSKKTRLTKSKYDETVAAYASAVREVGAQGGLAVVDWHAATADYLAQGAGSSDSKTGLTLDGLAPRAAASALGAEAFLQAIGAEPLEVELELDWATLEAGTSVGSASAARLDDTGVAIELHGLPIPWLVSGRGRAVQPASPGSTMCRYTLHLRNAPPGGVLISKPGGRPMGFSAQAVEAGIDLGSVPAVVRTRAAADLLTAIKSKNKALDRYERYMTKPRPEPEYAEANRKYLEAMVAEAQGAARIIGRTPRVIDLTLEIRPAGTPAP
jgi:hypothetical protein